MIKNIRHKGLEKLYLQGSIKGVDVKYAGKIRRVLAAMESAARPEHLAAPGFGLHPLKGDLKGFWSITVSANWRIIFRFDDTDACDVDLVDYH